LRLPETGLKVLGGRLELIKQTSSGFDLYILIVGFIFPIYMVVS